MLTLALAARLRLRLRTRMYCPHRAQCARRRLRSASICGWLRLRLLPLDDQGRPSSAEPGYRLAASLRHAVAAHAHHGQTGRSARGEPVEERVHALSAHGVV